MPTVETLSGRIISIDLGSRDFEGYRADVLDSGGLADLYLPAWSDRSELDLGVASTEVFSFMGDNLSYYQDRCGNEALFVSCRERRSAIEHCKLIGYEMRPAVSAQVEQTFVTSGAGTVPAETSISVDTSDGSDPASFELEEDFVSTGAGTYTGVIAFHGRTVSEVLGSGNNLVSQRVVLSSSPLAANPNGNSSLRVYVDQGSGPVLWAQVDTFLEAGSADQVYKVEISEQDAVTCIFGDGVNGQKPASGVDNITGDYRVGGGSAGNEVGPNRLTKLAGAFAFVVSVTNPSVPSGGREKETVEEAKINAPASLQAFDRAVRHSDYVIQAKKVTGVSDANAYRGEGAFEERIVIVAGGSNPVPTGSWDPYTESGTGLLGSVGAYVEARKTTPVILWVDPINVVDAHLAMNVYLFNNVRQVDARRGIDTAVRDAFNVENMSPGQVLPLSRVDDVVEKLSGVDYLDVTRLQRVRYARQRYGQADLTFGAWLYGNTTSRDRWTIQFTGPTTFSVSGSNKGLQVNSGTVGTPYLIDDETFGFTVTATSSPTAVDRQEIIVGEYRANISPDSDEICRLLNDTFELNLYGGVG